MSNILYWGFPRSIYHFFSVRYTFYRPLLPMIRSLHDDDLGSNFDFKTRLRMRLIKETDQLQCKNTKDNDASQIDIVMSSEKKEPTPIGQSSKSAGIRNFEIRVKSSVKAVSDKARESKIPTNAADGSSIGKIKQSKSVKFGASSSAEGVNKSADRSSVGNILTVKKATKESAKQNENKLESKTKDSHNALKPQHALPWRGMFGEHFKNEAMHIKEMYIKPKLAKPEEDKPFTVGGLVPHKMETNSNFVEVDNPKVEAKGQSEGIASRSKPTLSISHMESQKIIQKLFPSKPEVKTDSITNSITIVDAEGNSVAVRGSDRVLSRAKTDVLKSKFKRSTYKALKMNSKRSALNINKKKENVSFPLKKVEEHSAEQNQSKAVEQDEVKIDASKGPVDQSSQPTTSQQTVTVKTGEIIQSESAVPTAAESNQAEAEKKEISLQAEAVNVATTSSSSEADKLDESKVINASTDNQTQVAKAEEAPKVESKAENTAEKSEPKIATAQMAAVTANAAAMDEPNVQSTQSSTTASKAPASKSLCRANVEKWMARAKQQKLQEEKRQKLKKEAHETDNPKQNDTAIPNLFPNLPFEKKFFKQKVFKRPYEVKPQIKKHTEPHKPKASVDLMTEPAKEASVSDKKDGLDGENFEVSPTLTRTYEVNPKDTSNLLNFFKKSKTGSNKACQTPDTNVADSSPSAQSYYGFTPFRRKQDEPNKNTIASLLEQESREPGRQQEAKKESRATIGDIIAQIRQKVGDNNAATTDSTRKSLKDIHEDRSKDGSDPAASLTDVAKDGTSKYPYVDGKSIASNAGATGVTYGKTEFLSQTIEKVNNESVCKTDPSSNMSPATLTRAGPIQGLTVDEPYVSHTQAAQLTDGASDLNELSKLSKLTEREKAEKELDENMRTAKIFRKEAEKERTRTYGSIIRSMKDKSQSEPSKTDDKTANRQRLTITQSFSRFCDMILGKRTSGNNDGGRKNITTYTASLDKSKEGPSQEDPKSGPQKFSPPGPEKMLEDDVFITPDLEKYGLGKEVIREERKRKEEKKETPSQVHEIPKSAKSGTGSIYFAGADASADNAMGINKSKANPTDDETRIRGGSLRESRTSSPTSMEQENDIIIKGGSRKMLEKLKGDKGTSRDENPGKIRFFATGRIFAQNLRFR